MQSQYDITDFVANVRKSRMLKVQTFGLETPGGWGILELFSYIRFPYMASVVGRKLCFNALISTLSTLASNDLYLL